MGRIKSYKAEKYLLLLLEEKSYWDRGAAVEGIFAFRKKRFGSILIDKMINDHMIESNIKRGFEANPGFYINSIINYSGKIESDRKYKNYLNIIAFLKNSRGDVFLRQVINNKNSKFRVAALKSLIRYSGKRYYVYIKTLRKEKKLREFSLVNIYKYGISRDLKIFINILNRDENVKHTAVAYKAVNRWGSRILKEKIYYNSLNNKKESFSQAGLLSFTNVKSKRLMNRLVYLAKKGSFQKTRIHSALNLRIYKSKKFIPIYIALLNEQFIHYERGGIDMVITGFTFGISSIFHDLHQKNRKKRFHGNINRILKHLKKLTRKDFSLSYEKWRDWAVFKGYTIGGRNILQYLFSTNSEIREKAVFHSIKILGFRNSKEFYRKYRAEDKESDVILLIAKLLIEKGFLKDE